MALLTLKDLSFTYPGRETKALCDVSFSMEKGEFALLMGESGYGKSTLLRQIKHSIAPAGDLTGEILFDGAPVSGLSAAEQASRIGYVGQDPDSQIVTDKVWHELAFGLESIGAPSGVIRRRVAEMSGFFGIEDWFRRDTADLSGGQKQLVNLASALTLSPDLLVLDEPTAMLDPIAASEFISILARVNRELGVSILIAEHRLDELLPICDRILVLHEGALAFTGTPRSLGEWFGRTGHPLLIALPAPMRIFASLGADGESPVSVREGRDFIERYAASHPHGDVPDRPEKVFTGKPALSLSNVYFSYTRGEAPVLRDFSLEAWPGEMVCVVGGNGAGKSTALKVLAGAEKPVRGKRMMEAKRLVMLPQATRTLFARDTVEEELAEMGGDAARVEKVAEMCGIKGLLARHPYDLSGGEMQKAGLAKLLIREPDVLLLDEPTKSLDAAFKQQFAQILRDLLDDGVAIVMVTHDIEFAAEYADRCVMLFDGEAAASASPRAFFTGNSFYTTEASRMARGILPMAVTVWDVVSAFRSPPPGGSHADPEPPQTPPVQPGERRDLTGLISAVSGLSVIGTMAWFFARDNRNYYLFALLLLIEIALPFLARFEARKPRARELVLIASICALAVAGRAAFFALPSMKPTLAVILLAGVSLGAEAGGVTGALSMFVSNFFFGQGPWTPWQMAAAALIGCLGGLLFHRKADQVPVALLSLFGAFSALVIYGGIMNPVSVLTFSREAAGSMILASYVTGFPLDAVHAASTFACLLLFSRPFIRKINRVKIKYGM